MFLIIAIAYNLEVLKLSYDEIQWKHCNHCKKNDHCRYCNNVIDAVRCSVTLQWNKLVCLQCFQLLRFNVPFLAKLHPCLFILLLSQYIYLSQYINDFIVCDRSFYVFKF